MKTITLLFAFILFFSIDAQSQKMAFNTVRKQVHEPVISPSVTPPSFPGGADELSKYIAANLQYPEHKIKKGVEGVVVVSYVVNSDGTLEDIRVTRSLDDAFDQAAVEMVMKMPRWQPSMENNTPKRSRYLLPIRFELAL